MVVFDNIKKIYYIMIVFQENIFINNQVFCHGFTMVFKAKILEWKALLKKHCNSLER